MLTSGFDVSVEEIADFCGVKKPTAGTWISGKFEPVGQPLLKLLTLLRYFNISNEKEFRSSKNVTISGEFIVLGIMTLEEMKQYIGYAVADTLLKVLTGRNNPYPDKEKKFASLVKEKSIQYQTALDDNSLLSKFKKPKAGELAPKPAQNISANAGMAMMGKSTFIKVFATSVSTTLELAKIMRSDQFTPEDRQKLRTVTNHSMHHLWDELKSLLSEASMRANHQKTTIK